MRRILRRLALAAVLPALLGSGAASTLDAQQRIERRWPLAADGAVKIFNFVGSVRVIGWDHDSVVVTGTVAEGMQFFGGGGRSGVKLGVEGSASRPDGAAVLVVRVPATADVWVRGAATDIETEGLIGTVDLGTVSGRLVAVGSPRALSVETMDGTLDVRGSPETLRAKTASGALRWEGAASDALLVSVSGSLRVNAGPLGRARLETISGSVLVDAALRPDADLTIETHSGNVEVVLPKGTPARVTTDAPTTVNGSPLAAPADAGKRAAPRQFDLNLKSSKASAATIVVRSFKGAAFFRDR
ncbi:MAG: hypothetical protein JNL44_03585 [Gemmatimonadetes bacterium]|nr:hypothetical protein [Gemmatimonadota bacterium]